MCHSSVRDRETLWRLNTKTLKSNKTTIKRCIKSQRNKEQGIWSLTIKSSENKQSRIRQANHGWSEERNFHSEFRSGNEHDFILRYSGIDRRGFRVVLVFSHVDDVENQGAEEEQNTERGSAGDYCSPLGSVAKSFQRQGVGQLPVLVAVVPSFFVGDILRNTTSNAEKDITMKTEKSTNPPIVQSINQLINWTTNQSINQSINQSMCGWDVKYELTRTFCRVWQQQMHKKFNESVITKITRPKHRKHVLDRENAYATWRSPASR